MSPKRALGPVLIQTTPPRIFFTMMFSINYKPLRGLTYCVGPRPVFPGLLRALRAHRFNSGLSEQEGLLSLFRWRDRAARAPTCTFGFDGSRRARWQLFQRHF
jgi:hypothetical protein